MPDAVLTTQNLTKRFGGFAALSDVSFAVRPGEILGLIGPNGSGKSTIFNLIAGMQKPTAGSIRFNGDEIGGRLPNQICHLGVGRTYQIPRPFRRLSIFENVLVPGYYGQTGARSRRQAWEAAEQALDLVGLPTDPKTSVDTLGAAGLKKLELARALATRPKLLLADESLGGLDRAEMEQAGALLKRVRSEMGVTIIWVEHIMGVLMKVVDRVIVLDRGEKVFEGSPAQVIRDRRVIEVYLGRAAAQAQ